MFNARASGRTPGRLRRPILACPPHLMSATGCLLADERERATSQPSPGAIASRPHRAPPLTLATLARRPRARSRPHLVAGRRRGRSSAVRRAPELSNGEVAVASSTQASARSRRRVCRCRSDAIIALRCGRSRRRQLAEARAIDIRLLGYLRRNRRGPRRARSLPCRAEGDRSQPWTPANLPAPKIFTIAAPPCRGKDQPQTASGSSGRLCLQRRAESMRRFGHVASVAPATSASPIKTSTLKSRPIESTSSREK